MQHTAHFPGSRRGGRDTGHVGPGWMKHLPDSTLRLTLTDWEGGYWTKGRVSQKEKTAA